MMKKKTVVIIDDEPLCIKRLEDDLNSLPDFEVVATATSAFKAVGIVADYQPDVLFLDVMMPVADGFEVYEEVRKVQKREMLVVFYSAFDNFILSAMRVSAFDFLLKPYHQEEFATVIGRLREKLSNSNGDVSPDYGCNAPKRIALLTISGLMLMHENQIFAFKFSDKSRMWEAYTTDGRSYRLRKQTNAKTLLSCNPCFVQVRQEVIVNIDFLLGIENNSLQCVFCPPFDGEHIAVSRKYYKAVKDMLEIV